MINLIPAKLVSVNAVIDGIHGFLLSEFIRFGLALLDIGQSISC